jgi:D-alanine-D-alanine ligase
LKDTTIALLYHPVEIEHSTGNVQEKQAFVDNQTDEIVTFMSDLFQKKKFTVQIIKVTPTDLSELKIIDADFVFNLVDSKAMEIQIAKILDRMQIPYSGTKEIGLRISNNKVTSKRIFLKHNLPTPGFTVIRPTDRLSRAMIPGKFPIIVKPAYEHCSIGITNKSIARTYRQFVLIVKRLRLEHSQSLLAEEFIEGKELQVTILETPQQTMALPIAEITFKGRAKNKWNIYGYDEKWSKHLPIYKSCNFIAPPKNVPEEIDRQIKRDAIRAFYALNMRDYGRFDLRYNPDTQKWFFLEGNANAGFDPNPRDAMTVSIFAQGMTLDEFILQIVQNSLHLQTKNK